jgi:hypothetical protein
MSFSILSFSEKAVECRENAATDKGYDVMYVTEDSGGYLEGLGRSVWHSVLGTPFCGAE